MPHTLRIHFIAIGGAAMHNLALALHHKGYQITGSDDEIKEPSRSRLAAVGLLPGRDGWFPEKLLARPDAVILGMHARADNPELLKAQELGLHIYSFPEYFYEQSKEKIRVVIGGSHGKTSITAMVMHVLRIAGINFDYMVGSTIEGFDTMVRLTNNAPIIILEGDEYLSSPIDRRPKFHLYRAHIGLLSGIAWDHINVFPTFENYVEQFRIFAANLPGNGHLIYYENDPELLKIASQLVGETGKTSYGTPEFTIHNGITTVIYEGEPYSLKIFGRHNLANMEGARKICHLLGVGGRDFYKAAGSFKGAGRRLELVKSDNHRAIFRDFAHSPSKLQATVEAVKEQYPDRNLIACFELHTFSSLSGNFLSEYAGSMTQADIPIVYFNPAVIAHKKLPPITENQVRLAFADERLFVCTNPAILQSKIEELFGKNTVLLMMSSGTFDGIHYGDLIS